MWPEAAISTFFFFLFFFQEKKKITFNKIKNSFLSIMNVKVNQLLEYFTYNMQDAYHKKHRVKW